MQNQRSFILIVDDKPANIFALENLLAKKNRSIITATNGKDALKIVLRNEIDLIILDVQMPDMDGFEVAQILKSNKRTKDIPIIFASAERKEHQFMVKGYEEGAIDYMHKPLNPEIAKAKVEVLLKIQLQKKELIEKNRLLQKSALLINNSADIIGIIDGNTFKIEEINQAFTRTLGYSLEETKTTTLNTFLTEEDQAMLLDLKKEASQQLSFETRIICKDKSIKWLQWNVIVKDGKWFVNARDITETRQVEKIRNYLATVVKQSNDAIYIHNTEGQFISWNKGAEKIYGYSEKEALQMNIQGIVPAFLQEETKETFRRILEGQKIQSQETKRLTKDGTQIDVLFSASVITDPANEQPSIAITERDITLQKIADEQIKSLNIHLQNNILQLEASNKELESFSYSVSHDLRAPLRILNSYARIIESEYQDIVNEEVKRLLVNIQSNAKKMNTLIDDLLEFSKLGKKEVKKARIDMEEMVSGVLNEINKSTTHDTTIKVAPLLPAKADYTLLHQVWVNLISNSIKYSGKKIKPVVEIGSTRQNNEVIYYVKDNGAGFDMQYSSKLFGVFQRLHSPKEFEGTGIGLAIVQRVINKHGGRVWAEAEIDEGATFYFTLP